MLEQQDCSALVFPKGKSAKAHLQTIKTTQRVKTRHMQPIQAARPNGNLQAYVLRHISNDQDHPKGEDQAHATYSGGSAKW